MSGGGAGLYAAFENAAPAATFTNVDMTSGIYNPEAVHATHSRAGFILWAGEWITKPRVTKWAFCLATKALPRRLPSPRAMSQHQSDT